MGYGKPKEFFGLHQDARAFAQFIQRYNTKFDRWNSPKFLFGESYGTPRSADWHRSCSSGDRAQRHRLAIVDSRLPARWSQDDTYVNSAVGGDGTLGYVFYFPSEAATAWYHNMVPHRGTEEQFIRDAAHFAMTTYQDALLAGDTLRAEQTRAMAERMHGYTGMPVQYIIDSHLMVPYGRFLGALLRSKPRRSGATIRDLRCIRSTPAAKGLTRMRATMR